MRSLFYELDEFDTGRFILSNLFVLCINCKTYYESKEITLYGFLTTA